MKVSKLRPARRSHKALSLGLTAAISSTLIAIPLPAHTQQLPPAQTTTAPFNTQLSARRIRFRPNVPPPRRGTPTAPHGTGSRGDCSFSSQSNEARPPLTHLVGNPGFDLTVSERPSFWVYVPFAQSDVSAATFSLQTADTEVYQQDIQLPTTPGIVEITMPDTVSPLEVGQSYRWYFEMTCPQVDLTEAATPATVTGVVKRVLPSAELEEGLAMAQTPLDKAIAYAESQVWYDVFSAIAHLRLSNPENSDLIAIWQELLSDPEVGLAAWAEVPLVGTALAESR